MAVFVFVTLVISDAPLRGVSSTFGGNGSVVGGGLNRFGSVPVVRVSVPSARSEVGWGVRLGSGGRFRRSVCGGRAFRGRVVGWAGSQAGGRPFGGVVPSAESDAKGFQHECLCQRDIQFPQRRQPLHSPVDELRNHRTHIGVHDFHS